MSRRPIDARIETGARESEEARYAPPSDFKEAMARWAAGVAIVAVRDPDDARVHATTVNSLAGVSAEPPRITVALGPGAQALPFLDDDAEFAVSVLTRAQKGLASRFTDAFPVGPNPFPSTGAPVVEGAHAHLICRVHRVLPLDGARIVVGAVQSTGTNDAEGPLLYYLRDYHTLE